jgi:hypothetical protein
MTAAQETAEREFELRRTELEADETAKVEAERTKQNNERSRERASRKGALVKILRDAHVTVPAEPSELVS